MNYYSFTCVNLDLLWLLPNELKSSSTVLSKKPLSTWLPFVLSQEEKCELICGTRAGTRMSWPSLSNSGVNQPWSSPAHF